MIDLCADNFLTKCSLKKTGLVAILSVLMLVLAPGCSSTKRGAKGSAHLHPDFIKGERTTVAVVDPAPEPSRVEEELGPLITTEVAPPAPEVIGEEVVAGQSPAKPGFFRSLFSSRKDDDSGDEEPAKVMEVKPPALSPEELAAIDAEMALVTEAVRTETDTRVTLRPGLLLDIKVMVAGKNQLEPDAIRIAENNSIFLPMLGQVPVNNFTLERLREELTSRYRRFFVNPEVLVDFARDSSGEGISPWGYVTVLGRVKNPGRIMIPATRDLTVSGAIQGAGGFDRSARINAIRVTRNRPDGSGQEQITINLNEVGSDGKARDDFVLGMDDIVFVPEARF